MNTKAKEKTENLEFEIDRKPDCLVELKIKSSAKLAEKAEDLAVKVIAKEVSIPGFRKGKAPAHLIRKNYAKALTEEAKKKLAKLAFDEAQEKINIPLQSRETPIQFNMENFSTTEELSFTINFETEPVVPEIKKEAMKFEKAEQPEITEEKVDSGLREILLVYADWKEITDRAVKENDYILADIEDMEKDPPEKAFSSIRLEMREKKTAKWIQDLAMGLKTGESKEGISEPDDHLTEEEKKDFKPKKVRLTVQRIEEAHLPEVNDEFCKKVGAKDPEAFRNHIKEVLTRHGEEFAAKKDREQISKLLVETFPFETPSSLTQKETHYRLRSLLSDPKFLKEWQAMSEEERKKAVDDLKEEAERAIRLFYICRKVVKDEGIKISDEEIAQALAQAPKENQAEEEALIYSRLTMEKAQDHLIKTLSS
ncbi:MAG: trigger factor [Candidatus Algichlamydia australiensis]|nr:trigger factor [Chlamydiales bacterium]